VTTCPANLPYYTEGDNPLDKCLDACPADEFLNSLTNAAKPTCIAVCYLANTAYYGVKSASPYCALSCPSTEPYSDILADEANPVCLSACPLVKEYWNAETRNGLNFKECKANCEGKLADSTAPPLECIDACHNTRPYIDSTGTQPTCRDKCPSGVPYANTVSGKDHCVEVCPAADNKFINPGAGSGTPPQDLCVATCPGTLPHVEVISAGKNLCINSCKTKNDNFAEVDASLGGARKCVSACTSGYADSNYLCGAGCSAG